MVTPANALTPVRQAFRRARDSQRRRAGNRTLLGGALTAVVCLLAGFMLIISALNARGSDLRPGRNTDLVSLVQSQSHRNTELRQQLTRLRDSVDQLRRGTDEPPDLEPRLESLAGLVGLRAVAGPAVTVTLNDAPDTVAAAGVDDDLLVVHQQDIQAVVNALWSGGAEAMTIQGQRVISTTGIKCVGNTVVLHGIPYAPPYTVRAIGDQQRLRASLAGSEPVRVFKQYVAAYGLVYDERTEPRAELPAHEGTLELQHARIYRGPR